MTVEISLYSYKEADVQHLYCPELRLYGYGPTEDEAEEYFDQEYKSFIEHSSQLGNLPFFLKRIGWVENNQLEMEPPMLDYMIKEDPGLYKVINEKEFCKYLKTIKLHLS